jgi:hypothetical protein
MHPRLLFILLFGLLISQTSMALSPHLPDRLNLDILPVTVSATHLRGFGLGLALEKVNEELESITSIQGELSFPVLQKRLGKNAFIDGPADFNGSLTLLAKVRPTLYIGGKVGASMLVPDGPVGMMAFSIRMIPKDPESWGFFSFATRQLDMGIYANHEMYAAIRLGFQLYHH